VKQGAARPPSWLLSASDLPRATREAVSLLSLPAWFAALPRGDGHPVMVLPGFAGDDSYNLPLIRFLKALGYHAVGWKQGRNLGHSSLDPQRLGMRVAKLNEHEGRRISLVGHSLGGVFAREAARRHPERVRQVISLGSPIGSGRRGASRLDRVYASLNRKPGQTDESQWHLAPPVPTTAVYSRTDGIIDWRVALQQRGHGESENVEVCGSHNGLTLNPMVWMLLANRLAQPENDWRPFRTRGVLRMLYPRAAWRATEEPRFQRAGLRVS
jgi:pimeloyl-ACP methyl ester carboxylesterase